MVILQQQQQLQQLGTRNILEAGLRQVVQQLVVADLGVAVDPRRQENKSLIAKFWGFGSFWSEKIEVYESI